MSSDIGSMLRMVGLLGDQGFVDALTDVEGLVDDANETLDRVERIEGEAAAAVREANEALVAVDERLATFDETISLLEAKIEAGFSVGFFLFAANRWIAGEPLFAAGLLVLGLLGASSLAVTIATMPQVRRLRKVGRFATDRVDRHRDGERFDGPSEERQSR